MFIRGALLLGRLWAKMRRRQIRHNTALPLDATVCKAHGSGACTVGNNTLFIVRVLFVTAGKAEVMLGFGSKFVCNIKFSTTIKESDAFVVMTANLCT